MKVVVFDFDGTLTVKGTNVWKGIWGKLGYNVGENSYYKKLYNKYINKEISYKQWCALTCKAFQDRNFNKKILDEIVSSIKVMKGVKELFDELYNKGVEINIVSGNILDAIEYVLKDESKYINEIKANDFVFDDNGNLISINGTDYDYEGKAKYIEEIASRLNISTKDIYYVGNSANDEYVYLSGAKTICINPDETKTDDINVWNTIIEIDDLKDLSHLLK